MSFFDLCAKTLGDNAPFLFSSLKGKPVLIVNVASKCGYTRQYTGLQSLSEEFKAQGVHVIGFPCNQFGSQEPGSPKEIIDFCTSKYSVDFPLLEKVEVNGSNVHPVFQFLKSKAKVDKIGWNFEKFLVNGDGSVVKHFGSGTTPEQLKAEIKSML